MDDWGMAGWVGWLPNGFRVLSNKAPLVLSDALNVRIVTVMRRTWESTVTSAR